MRCLPNVQQGTPSRLRRCPEPQPFHLVAHARKDRISPDRCRADGTGHRGRQTCQGVRLQHRHGGIRHRWLACSRAGGSARRRQTVARRLRDRYQGPEDHRAWHSSSPARARDCGQRSGARAMAKGALGCSIADLSVSITGVAGPGPDEDGNPVGLVHIAAARRTGATMHRNITSGISAGPRSFIGR